jgi:hypothetical protein
MHMTERPRVLLLIPHLGGGGAEQVVALLARGLSPEKYELHLGLATQARTAPDAMPSWVRVHAMGASRVRSSGFKLLQLVRRIKPDVILSGMFHLNFLVLLLRPFFPRGTSFWCDRMELSPPRWPLETCPATYAPALPDALPPSGPRDLPDPGDGQRPCRRVGDCGRAARDSAQPRGYRSDPRCCQRQSGPVDRAAIERSRPASAGGWPTLAGKGLRPVIAGAGRRAPTVSIGRSGDRRLRPGRSAP